ncbi:MAG: acyl-CoA carboxylase subunit beta [Bdellovibrionota bacterium]
MSKAKKPTILSEPDAAGKKKRLGELSAEVEAGGGEKSIARQRERGKMLASERAAYLFDKGTFQEMDRYMGSSRKLPRAGVLTGWGKIEGRPAVVIANLNDVKAGAWYPETIRKILKAQDYSREQMIPVIFLVDCAGLFLPEQDQSFPDKEHAGGIFYRMSQNSGLFPQVAGVFGPCVAGGAYVPGLADFAPMVAGRASLFLGGPKLTQAAVGEQIGEQELGGAKVHCEVSGIGDMEVESDQACLDSIRRFLSYLPTNFREAPPARASEDPPERSTPEIENAVATDRRKVYDMHKVIGPLVDKGSFFELRPRFGRQLLTGFALLGGKPVGIVANQPHFMGGILDTAASDKGAWFISLCDSFNVPLLFLMDVPGFLVGSKAEHRGIIHSGARMIQNLSRASVPKFTVVVRKAYGAGYYAMCGASFGPERIFALPTAEVGVMSPAQVGSVVYGEKLEAAQGDEKKKLEDEMNAVMAHHEETLSVETAASRGWIDEIISPENLRARLCAEMSLSARKGLKTPPPGKRPVEPV